MKRSSSQCVVKPSGEPRHKKCSRVESFIEFADELLKNGTPGGIVNHIGMQIDVLKPLQHLEEQARFVQPGDGIVKIKLLQHFPHVRREAVNIIAQVGGQVRRVAQQLVKIKEGCIIEGVAGGLAQQLVRVLQLILVLSISL